MKTYIFPITLEQSDDAWHVFVPGLESRGAVTSGKTRDEALRNIQEVLQMVVGEYLEKGEALPPMVTVADQPSVAVSI